LTSEVFKARDVAMSPKDFRGGDSVTQSSKKREFYTQATAVKQSLQQT